MTDDRTLTGQLNAPDAPLPAWAQDQLHFALRDRDEAPDAPPICHAPLTGPDGAFNVPLSEDAALRLAMIGHRDGPQHVAALGWGAALDPLLAYLPWPGAGLESVTLNWDGSVTVIGFVEQLHMQEIGGLPLLVAELAGYAVPHTYRRLPPLPQAATEDRHGLHADRPLEDSGPEQVYYLLADAESPLVTFLQDSLVSNMRVVCGAALAPQEGGWHEIVNVPLLLESISLLTP